MNACAFIVGEKNTIFLYHRYKIIENDETQEGILLNATNTSLDPYDYHVERCGIDAFKKIENELIHTCWLGQAEDEGDILDIEDEVEEDENEELIETQDHNGNNEMFKLFNQECVICLERDSIYAFRQCGHQCSCQDCYENKGDIDIKKCVVCRT